MALCPNGSTSKVARSATSRSLRLFRLATSAWSTSHKQEGEMSDRHSNATCHSTNLTTEPTAGHGSDGTIDYPLCVFSFLGQVFELRFHPRPDHKSPFVIESAQGARESKRRYYLRVDQRRRLMHAVHGDDTEQNTPFDDVAFRLVYVGESIPRVEISDGSTRWCSCPRVRGLHPVFFCNRITIPNWQHSWAWRRTEVAPKLRVDLAEETAAGELTSTDEAVVQAQSAYPELNPVQRSGGRPEPR